MGAHFCRHFRNSSRLCRRPKGNGAPHAGRAIHHPVLAPTLPSAYRVDLLVGRKPAGLLLGESEPAIDGNLKHPADPGHQLDIGAVFLLQPIPRTEGTRFIVSRLAPLDLDFHRSSSLVRNDGAVLPRGFRSFQARRRNARWHRERLEKAGAARGIAGDHLGCGADAHRRPERCAADSGPRGRSGNGSPAGHGLF